MNIDRNQDSPEFWDGQGCALCQQEQYSDAIAAFDRAIQLDANYSRTWNNRANALSGMKRYAEALAAYERAIAIQPHYHQAWFNRGLLLVEMMAYGNALESFERAISIEPAPQYLHAKADIWIKKKLVAFEPCHLGSRIK